MEGVLQKLNRPKALVVVVVIAFIINGLLFYRYQHNLSEALATGPSLAAAEPSSTVSTAAPTSFAAPTSQKASSPAKKTDGESRSILASALDTLGLTLSPVSSQIPYVPLSHLSASSPKETHDAPVGANPTEAPSTEEVAPAADREVNEQAVDAAAIPAAVLGPASVPDDEEPEPKERPSAASPIAPPAPQNSTESADTAPNSILEESVPEEDESTERGEALWQPPPDEETHPPSSPVEKTGPPLAPTSQAQCRDRAFAAFGFENEDECLSFVTSQGKNEPGKDEKE